MSATTALGLDSCVRALRTGDVLVVWKLDRLGRTLVHLVNTVQDLSTRGVGLRVLTGQGAQIDTTTTAAGRLVFGIFAALAEFERELIRERTWPGSRPRGRADATAAGRSRCRRPRCGWPRQVNIVRKPHLSVFAPACRTQRRRQYPPLFGAKSMRVNDLRLQLVLQSHILSLMLWVVVKRRGGVGPLFLLKNLRSSPRPHGSAPTPSAHMC